MREPAYRLLHRRGLLVERVTQAAEILRCCTLCPRRCLIDRTAGRSGVCLLDAKGEVASANPHFGEEAPLVGSGGSGTIFFSSCNLRCVFCQNYEISQRHRGPKLTAGALAEVMLRLQRYGCHNINLVTPTHQVPAILAGLVYAVEGGLNIPLVYNSSGYDSVDALRLLAGIVDIYLPDLKTLDPLCAAKYLRAADYPEAVRAALKEMHRQVGELVIDADGVARRGLLVRHLVMPASLSSSERAFEFIRDELSPGTYLNIMAQWHPDGEAQRFPQLDQPLSRADYQRALAAAGRRGLARLDHLLASHLFIDQFDHC